jgi:hypothetical protein
MVDIKKQDVMFFAIVRKLKTFGLDPKYNLKNKHVTTMECWFLFRGSKKFKMKSPSLRLEDKVGMEGTYWKVFGTTSITNYEMHAWIVQGFITISKGIDINQAKGAKSIAKEKARRDEIKNNGRLGVVKRKTNNKYFKKWWEHDSQLEVKVSQLAPNNPRLEDVYFAPLEDDMRQSSYTMNK